MYRTIVEAVCNHGRCLPDKPAICFKQTTITYRELRNMILSMAFLLKTEYGIASEDTIMISAVSKPEYVVALLSLQYIGAVTVPVDKAALEENICDVYFFNNARYLLTDMRINHADVKKISLRELYRRCTEHSRNCLDGFDGFTEETFPAYGIPDGDRVAEMLFTTGTTGQPKGAMLSYKNIYAITCNTRDGVGMREEDIVLLPMPLNHSVGMRVLRTILYIGATLVIQNGFSFPKELKENLKYYSCTGFVCVPAVLERLYRQLGTDFAMVFSGLRYMEIGAGSLSLDMKKKMLALLPDTKIVNTWGSTETGGAIFLNASEYPDKLSSLGRPVNGIEVKVVDQDGHSIEATDIETAGRMALKGDMQMMGYYHLEEATADALRDGWLFTNDLVYMDEDGFIYMLGRADDIINVGGEKVSPIEVENIASLHPDLYECACVGVEDPEGILGQVPVLYYVPEEGKNPGEKEMIQFLSQRMEAYKLPKSWIRLTELPRNRMKKLDRKQLQMLWKNNGKADLSTPVIENILSRRSIRQFKDQVIPKPVLEQLLACAIAAPSANNMQTWRFYVLQGSEKIKRLKMVITDAIERMEGKKVKFYGFNNPDTVVILTNDIRNKNGAIDCACAAENLMLAASSLGIGSVWNNALIHLCEEDSVKEYMAEIGIHKRHRVYSVICLGYPDETIKKVERRQDIVYWI